MKWTFLLILIDSNVIEFVQMTNVVAFYQTRLQQFSECLTNFSPLIGKQFHLSRFITKSSDIRASCHPRPVANWRLDEVAFFITDPPLSSERKSNKNVSFPEEPEEPEQPEQPEQPEGKKRKSSSPFTL